MGHPRHIRALDFISLRRHVRIQKLTSMMRKSSIALFVVHLALVSCSNGSGDPFVITSETEYAVYRTLIEYMYVHDDRKLIVITSKTVFDSSRKFDADSYKPRDIKVFPETFNSIESRNRQSETLDCTKLALSVSCKILGQQELQELFPRNEVKIDQSVDSIKDSWNRYYEKYPGAQGIMQVSRIGFDTDGSQALVYVANFSGLLLGGGYYVLLVREENTWVIHDISVVWGSEAS